MENGGKTEDQKKAPAPGTGMPEDLIIDAINKLRRNFPEGDCKVSFKLPGTDRACAIALTGEAGEYTLCLSLLTPRFGDTCELQTCCPVQGSRGVIHRYLWSWKVKKQLMDRIGKLLDA